VDLAPYSLKVDRAAVRSEFGFRASNTIFGHVGRFDTQKNHAFLIDIATEIAKRDSEARFLLVGDGPLRPSIEEQVRRAGIASRTVFAGSRPDVPRLTMGTMDRFLFPSLYEGLGLALIEAQAAGLPATISDVIPSEADVVPNLITRLSLRQPAAVWAEHALHPGECGTPGALAEVERCPFNVIASTNKLTELYDA
jgi:glycosyltransferase involved in cell wall biosynthesis